MVDSLVTHFNNLSHIQGSSMAVPIRFAEGSGILLITKAEWEQQLTEDAKKDLVKVRLETLFRRINGR